jgi:hypothetical protein
MASSLVGAIIKTPVPFYYVNLALYNNSAAGIMNANVFPDPVLAAPRTSLPFKICGIDLA